MGAGWVAGARHVPAFKRVKGVDVAAVYDRDVSRARELAQRSKIAAAHDNLDGFFAEHLDAVAICTSPWSHSSLAVAALRNGCHVLTEKPMAMSPAEAAEMNATATETGKKLGVCHNFLFSRSMRKAKALMDRGQVGEVQKVMGLQLSSASRRLPVWYHDLPGGLFFDESPHLLYLIRHFLGDLQIEFCAIRRSDDGGEVADLRAEFQGQRASGTLIMTFDAPVSEWMLLVVGSRSVLLIDVFRDMLTVLRSDGSHSWRDVLTSSARTATNLATEFAVSGALYSTGRLLFGHEVLIEGFVRAVERGTSPTVTGEDGAAILDLMCEILGARGQASEVSSASRC